MVPVPIQGLFRKQVIVRVHSVLKINHCQARCSDTPIPVIPADQETEAGGLKVRGTLRQFIKTLSQKKKWLEMQLSVSVPLGATPSTTQRVSHS